jgi:predicted lipoprotein with Yx(FWY)xxD motif
MFGLRKLSVVLALVLLLAFGAAALAQGTSTVQVAQSAQLGNILADNKGMTLYLYTKDTPGVSNCSGGCLAAWPALTVPAGATPVAGPGVTAKLGTITRSDGVLQVTANDMPLYYWAKDKAAGDVTGQGVGGVWYVLDPTGAMVKTALAAATPAAGAATAAPTAAAAATTAPAAAAAAATAEPTAAAPAPAKLPTTGAGTDWLVPALTLAALLAVAGFGLTQSRRTR